MSNEWAEPGQTLHQLLGDVPVAVHLPGHAGQHRQWISVSHGTERLWMMQQPAPQAQLDSTDLWPAAQQVALHPTPFVDRGAGDTMAQVWAAATATMNELHEHWECWLLPDPV